MNREIKFRIWDKKEKRFHCPNNNAEWLVSLDGEVFHHCGGPLNKKDYALQQYTGLEDSNEKEIYEGDILEITQEPDFCHEPDKWYGFYGVVEFDYKSVGFRVQKYEDFGSSKKDGDSDDFYYLDRIFRTVIGNIFENPELLK